MPAKFKGSENRIVNRKIVGKRHFYLHATSTDEIVKAYENDNTKPKLKNKYKNELVKRGVLSYQSSTLIRARIGSCVKRIVKETRFPSGIAEKNTMNYTMTYRGVKYVKSVKTESGVKEASK